MSMYEKQYLGMYIELEYNTQTKDNFTRKCPNGHSLHNRSAKFCSECGAEIIEENNPVEISITYPDLVDDELLPVDIDDFSIINIDSSDKTWLVQNLTKGKYGLFLSDADYGAYSLSVDTDEILNSFLIEFEDFIAALRIHCKSVKINYGLVKYYN